MAQDAADERRRAQVRGDHAAAHVSLLQGIESAIAGTERPAHETLAAVAADHVADAPGFAHAVAAPFRLDYSPVRFHCKVVDLPAEAQRDIGPRACIVEQERLDIHLVRPQDRLGDLIGRGRCGDGAHLLRLRRHADARELPRVEAGEVGDVGRMVGREAQSAHRLGDP